MHSGSVRSEPFASSSRTASKLPESDMLSDVDVSSARSLSSPKNGDVIRPGGVIDGKRAVPRRQRTTRKDTRSGQSA